MILVIDNYDSFTWNLVHLVAASSAGGELKVVRNDEMNTEEAIGLSPRAVVLSPGPRTPDDAGNCLSLVAAAAEADLPLFGVCLGLQAIAQSFGGKIERAEKLMHGKTSKITHNREGLFAGVAQNFTATRYHSLVVNSKSLPECLEPTATASDDGEIMALQHKEKSIAAVQFHPESIASEFGVAIIENFLKQISKK